MLEGRVRERPGGGREAVSRRQRLPGGFMLGGSTLGSTLGFTLGFTLIEILIALMVLSIGMASVLALFIAGVRASQEVVDESAAALCAKAVLERILSQEGEDEEGKPVRVFLNAVVEAREEGYRSVWIHPLGYLPAPGSPHYLDTDVPRAAPVAAGSHYSWRCRASSYRSNPQNPVMDLGRLGPDEGEPVMLKEGRIPEAQMENPDSDELWRLAIEVYRKYEAGARPLAVFQVYVCTAHL